MIFGKKAKIKMLLEFRDVLELQQAKEKAAIAYIVPRLEKIIESGDPADINAMEDPAYADLVFQIESGLRVLVGKHGIVGYNKGKVLWSLNTILPKRTEH